MKDSKIDRLLMRSAGTLSAKELSERTGLPVEDVARRTQELFDNINPLTFSQRRTQAMIALQEVQEEARDRLPGLEDKLVAGMVNASVNATKTILKELREMERADKGELEAYERSIALTAVKMIEATYNREIGKLIERFPELDRAEMESGFQKTLLEVAKEYDAE